jgi:hypothetical protein
LVGRRWHSRFGVRGGCLSLERRVLEIQNERLVHEMNGKSTRHQTKVWLGATLTNETRWAGEMKVQPGSTTNEVARVLTMTKGRTLAQVKSRCLDDIGETKNAGKM